MTEYFQFKISFAVPGFAAHGVLSSSGQMEDRVQQRGDDQHGAASSTAASSGRRQGRQSLLLQPELPQNHPEAAGLYSRLRTLPILVLEDHLGNITLSMPLDLNIL